MGDRLLKALSRGSAAALIALAGCASDGLWGPGPTGSPDDAIQQRVLDRLADQRDTLTAEEQWAVDSDAAYQTDADVGPNRRRLNLDSRRTARAAGIIERGPLELRDALTICLELNDQVLAAREEIRSVGGDELVVNSRFLPQLNYAMDAEGFDKDGRDIGGDWDHQIRGEVTFFEFGRDNPVDVALRQQQRSALFAYEDATRDALSDTRRLFYTVLLREQQVAQRYRLVAEFRDRLDQVHELVKQGRAVELDVLTARLNVLSEELRINQLENAIVRLKVQLLHVMGLPVSATEIKIAGQLDAFELPLKDTIGIALRRSTEIAQSRATFYEQYRVASQIGWVDAPAVAARAGWKDGTSRAGVDLDSNAGTYTVSGFAEKQADIDGPGVFGSGDRLSSTEQGWFVGINLDVPIFTGKARQGRRIRELAQLAKSKHLLRDQVDLVELNIRQLYQSLLEARRQKEFQDQTVAISRQRLQIQERLKDLGKISDNELETFRAQFFSDQDRLFSQQISLVEAQERLRQAMRYFEPSAPQEEQP